MPRDPNSVTSVSLLEQARKDPEGTSWERLVTIYADLIEKWLLQRGLPQQEVDDVRQEVMTVMVRELPKFEHNGRTGAFRNWLRMITANRLKQFWDKKKRNRALSAADVGELANQLQDPHSSVSRVWNAQHDRVVLDRLLRLLSSQFQESSLTAFRRMAIEQCKASDVAAELGMSLNAVRIAQSRVMRALRELSDGLLE